MSMFTGTPLLYNISCENEIASILSHFNTKFIIDIMQENLERRVDFFQIGNTNIINSFESYFKQIKQIYTGDVDKIDQVRNDTYIEIINILTEKCGLVIVGEIQDVYSAAFYLYDLLVGSFTNNIVSFFTNFIMREKNSLYDSLNLSESKKNKDSSTLYTKKIYKNPKVAIINANLEYVIENICGFDIAFNCILNNIYADKNIPKYIQEIVVPRGDFFKENYVTILNTTLRPILLTSIRLAIQPQAIADDVDITTVSER